MLIETWIFITIIAFALFYKTIYQGTSGKPEWAIFAVTFVIFSAFGSLNIEKPAISSTNTICNSVTEYNSTDTSHCMDYTTTHAYTTLTLPEDLIYARFMIFIAILLAVYVIAIVMNNMETKGIKK